MGEIADVMSRMGFDPRVLEVAREAEEISRRRKQQKMDSRLIKLAEAAQEQAGGMTVDDLITSIERSVEVNKRAYSRYRNFNIVAAMEKYAAKFGKFVQNLTEDERRQAFLDHILENSG